MMVANPSANPEFHGNLYALLRQLLNEDTSIPQESLSDFMPPSEPQQLQGLYDFMNTNDSDYEQFLDDEDDDDEDSVGIPILTDSSVEDPESSRESDEWAPQPLLRVASMGDDNWEKPLSFRSQNAEEEESACSRLQLVAHIKIGDDSSDEDEEIPETELTAAIDAELQDLERFLHEDSVPAESTDTDEYDRNDSEISGSDPLLPMRTEEPNFDYMRKRNRKLNIIEDDGLDSDVSDSRRSSSDEEYNYIKKSKQKLHIFEDDRLDMDVRYSSEISSYGSNASPKRIQDDVRYTVPMQASPGRSYEHISNSTPKRSQDDGRYTVPMQASPGRSYENVSNNSPKRSQDDGRGTILMQASPGRLYECVSKSTPKRSQDDGRGTILMQASPGRSYEYVSKLAPKRSSEVHRGVKPSVKSSPERSHEYASKSAPKLQLQFDGLDSDREGFYDYISKSAPKGLQLKLSNGWGSDAEELFDYISKSNPTLPIDKNGFALDDDKKPQSVHELSFDDDFTEDDGLQSELDHLSSGVAALKSELMSEACSRSARESVNTRDAGSSSGVYSLGDHCGTMNLCELPNGGYVIDMSSHFMEPHNMHLSNIVQEYCQPIPFETLGSMFAGLDGIEDCESLGQPGCPVSHEGRVPFRTLTIRIRPDVMCDSVMNLVCLSFKIHKGHVIKQEGGHVRAVVLNSRLSFVIDAQLCTSKIDEAFSRHLLLRFYYLSREDEKLVDGKDSSRRRKGRTEDSCIALSNLHLREACSLIQRMKSTRRGWLMGKKAQSLDSPVLRRKKDNTKEAASTYLRSHFQHSPSVRRLIVGQSPSPSDVYPSLSTNDWLFIHTSSAVFSSIWESLERRFVYSTIASFSFGKYPCLATLDAHYCDQLQQVVSERMLFECEKEYKDLVKKVLQSEEALSTFMDITKPVFKRYGLPHSDWPKEAGDPAEDEPEAPRSISTPRSSTSPYGSLIEKALEKVQVRGGDDAVMDPEESLRTSQEPVNDFLLALEDQYAREYGPQREKAYTKAMDRIFRLRNHLIESYERLQECHLHSEFALSDGDRFLELVEQSGQLQYGDVLDKVPIARFSVSNGMCYITASHMLFAPKSRLGRKRKPRIFDLADIDLKCFTSSKVAICAGSSDDVVYSFVPSIKARPLQQFFYILQTLKSDEQSFLKSANPRHQPDLPPDRPN